MNYFSIKRRTFIKLTFGLALLGLVGCKKATSQILFRSPKGTLPKELLSALPSTWQCEELGIDPYKFISGKDTDFLAIQDGWIDGLPIQDLLTIESGDLSQSFSSKSKNFLSDLGSQYENKILPIGVSPWVMVFRNGESWLDNARESWEVLFDPKLEGEIVLPNSPRLLLSLLQKSNSLDQLQRLRRQVKAYDDLNAMNWLLSGKSRVAVLPLQRCLTSLTRDPRLSIALPRQGAPLSWTVLVRPASGRSFSDFSWLKESYKLPLLGRLLAKGFFPPIPYSELSKGKNYLREDLQSSMFPSREVWERCWSLPPLSKSKKENLEQLWINSTL